MIVFAEGLIFSDTAVSMSPLHLSAEKNGTRSGSVKCKQLKEEAFDYLPPRKYCITFFCDHFINAKNCERFVKRMKCDSTCEKGPCHAFFQNRVIATIGKSRL